MPIFQCPKCNLVLQTPPNNATDPLQCPNPECRASLRAIPVGKAVEKRPTRKPARNEPEQPVSSPTFKIIGFSVLGTTLLIGILLLVFQPWHRSDPDHAHHHSDDSTPQDLTIEPVVQPTSSQPVPSFVPPNPPPPPIVVPVPPEDWVRALADLKNESLIPEIRANAAQYIGRVGPRARVAGPALMTALGSHSKILQEAAADALRKMAPFSQEDLSWVAGDGVDPDPDRRAFRIHLLGQAEAPSADLAAALRPFLADNLKGIRDAAMDLIKRTNLLTRPDLYRLLIPALADPDDHIRAAAAEKLRSLGRANPADLPIFHELLPISGCPGQLYILEQIKALRSRADSELPDVQALLESPDAAVRALALQTGMEIVKDAEQGAQLADGIFAMCKDANPKVRLNAVMALSWLPRSTPELFQAVMDAMADEDKAIHKAAEDIFAGLLPLKASEILELGRALSATQPFIREDAAHMLARCGKDAEPLINKLIDALKDDDLIVRRYACEALAAMGAKAAPAMEKLISLAGYRVLEDRALPPNHPQRVEHALLRNAAIEALSHLHAKLAPALTNLISLMRNTEDPEQKATLIRLIGSIGPAATESVLVILDEICKFEPSQLTIFQINGAHRGALSEVAIEAVRKMGPKALIPIQHYLEGKLSKPNLGEDDVKGVAGAVECIIAIGPVRDPAICSMLANYARRIHLPPILDPREASVQCKSRVEEAMHMVEGR